MKIKCIWEHNGNDSLIYAENCVGAFARGESLDMALQKLPSEIQSFYAWLGEDVPEEKPLTLEEYTKLPKQFLTGRKLW